jgi:WD40 repeat protein
MSEAPLNHPTADELRALSLGQLTESDLARVSAHLGECPECCRRLDQQADDDPLLARLQQSAIRRKEILVTPAQRRSAVRALREGRESKAAAQSRDPEAEPVILPAPRQVGDYDILAEVGRRGMGVVYKARHRSLQRLAALKMVLAGELASPTQELRFRLEAELAARVQYPNIVQVYEIGSCEGRPFLALERVEDGSLASRLDGKPWPPGEAAALIETLARAIHVAHGEGVVHRDLKPANTLLKRDEEGGMKDETKTGTSSPLIRHPSSLLPKITDFGLAQPTKGGMTLTHSGFLVGTPGYMAPEQAAGKRALVGPATDTYALRVVLYQLLTGQLPFQGDSALGGAARGNVRRSGPAAPLAAPPAARLGGHHPALPGEGAWPALPQRPGAGRRPRALPAGEQVVARPVGAAARLARACRRRPLVALLLTLLTLTLFGGLAGVTWKWLEADEQRDRANQSSLQATDEKRKALFQTYRARIAAAVAVLSTHDVEGAARQLKEASQELRDWEWRHLHARLDDSLSVIPLPAEQAGLFGAPARLRAWALTSAGLRLTDLEGGDSKTLPLDRERGRSVTATQTRRGLRVAAWVGNTTFDLLDEADRVLWRVEMPEAKEPSPVAVSPDGTRLVFPRVDGHWLRLVVCDASSGKRTAVCEGHRGLWAYTFSPDGTRLVSGGEDGTARLWDSATGALMATCEGHASKVVGAAFRPDGARLVTTWSDGTVRPWDAATGRQIEAPYDRHTGEVVTAVYSPDGQWVASAGTDRTVRVWRATGRQDLAILHGHTGAVTGVAFAPDGRRLASLSSEPGFFSAGDGTVRVWDVDPRATLPLLRGHTWTVYPVAFSPDGRWLASGSWDTRVRLWGAATGEPCATLPHPGIVPSSAFSPDGTWLVSGTDADNRPRVWDVATARLRKEIQGPAGIFRFVTVSPDGRRVAATAFDPQSNKHQLQFCDLASGKRLFSAEGGSLSYSEGWPAAYSPNGRWLAMRAADDKTIFLLDARTHETAARFSGHDKFVFELVFSHDSRHLASCSQDRTVRVWEIDPLTLPSPPAAGGEGRVRGCQVLRGHTDEVFAAALHPDGKRLATGGRGRAVLLWDLPRGEEVARLPGHTDYGWSLAFSRDGKTLVSGSGDATVRLWDTAPLKTRYQARREAKALQPEAERLVEQLWWQKNDPAAQVESLRADPALSESLRHAALRLLMGGEAGR